MNGYASLFLAPAFRRRGTLVSLLACGALLSFALSIYGVSQHPTAAFYLLPTRAWELLVGSIIALLPTVRMPTRVREITSCLALVAILLPCFIYTSETSFPGVAALLPCLGTALFIAGTGTVNDADKRPFVARVLSKQPVVFIGLISYSLYLWHWPLLAYSNYWALAPISISYRLAMVGLGLTLAIVSWRFVETPFRKRQYCSSRHSIFALGLAGTATALALGILVHGAAGFPGRVPQESLQFARAASDAAFIQDLTTDEVLAGDLITIGASKPGAPVAWLIWGDSHAMATLPAFHRFLRDQGLSGQAATHSSTAPILNYYRITKYGLGPDSLAFNNAVITHLKTHRVPNAILVARWSAYDDSDLTSPGNHPFEESLIHTVKEIVEAGSRPWILLEIPDQKFNVPRALARLSMRNQDIRAICARPEGNDDYYRFDGESTLTRRLCEAGATILDPRPALLSEDGTYYRAAAGTIALYRDSHHLSSRGAETVILPVLKQHCK